MKALPDIHPLRGPSPALGLAVAALLVAGHAAAGEPSYPCWRGPNGSGAVSSGLPGIGTENGSFIGGDGRGLLELDRDAGSKIGMVMMEPGTTDLKPSSLPVPHDGMSTTPACAGGRPYLRMQDHIACWDLAAP